MIGFVCTTDVLITWINTILAGNRQLICNWALKYKKVAKGIQVFQVLSQTWKMRIPLVMK